MAECPGVHLLAAMADGGLARIRTPGGRLRAAQARAIARAAATLGSGEIDLTNRANLQIRGLAMDAGEALAALLDEVGMSSEGAADRRRNILLDPFSGLDPIERRDLSPLGQALDDGLTRAGWIAGLSPKFSFVLDGGGLSGVAATPSDVAIRATEDGLSVAFAGRAFRITDPADEADVLAAIARAAADVGPFARARDIPDAAVAAWAAAWPGVRPSDPPPPGDVRPVYGAAPTRDAGRVALTFPAPVGRLDASMLAWLADVCESDGQGVLALAPWSAVVVPGVAEDRAQRLLDRSVARGFTPVDIARRLTVVACAGAPACARAREPAKAIGREILALAASDPALLPRRPARLHLSACPKGCAGATVSDLLLLGSSTASGWTVHAGAAPRTPGPVTSTVGEADPRDVLRRLSVAR